VELLLRHCSKEGTTEAQESRVPLMAADTGSKRLCVRTRGQAYQRYPIAGQNSRKDPESRGPTRPIPCMAGLSWVRAYANKEAVTRDTR
jgi:hypothetical protein